MEAEPSLTFPSLAAAHTSTAIALGGMGAAGPPTSAADARTSVLYSLQGSGGRSASGAGPLPLASAIPAAWLAAPTLPMSAPATTAALSLDPAPIASINDRRVRLPALGTEEQEQASLYRLCRQWVQNDTELAEAHEPVSASKLPPLPPHSEAAAATLQQQAPQEPPLPASAAAAAGGGSSEPPAVEALLQHHRQHWASVRQHKQAQTAAREQRFAQRLQTVLVLAGAPAAPMPMQQ